MKSKRTKPNHPKEKEKLTCKHVSHFTSHMHVYTSFDDLFGLLTFYRWTYLKEKRQRKKIMEDNKLTNRVILTSLFLFSYISLWARNFYFLPLLCGVLFANYSSLLIRGLSDVCPLQNEESYSKSHNLICFILYSLLITVFFLINLTICTNGMMFLLYPTNCIFVYMEMTFHISHLYLFYNFVFLSFSICFYNNYYCNILNAKLVYG